MFPAKLTIMNKILRVLATFGVAWLLTAEAAAQSFPAVGTRAAGMGGAFVAVADDATAIYWNPAGLAAGSYFSLVLDDGSSKAAPDQSVLGQEGSSFLLGLAMPALGLGYYRLNSTTSEPGITLVPEDASLSSRNLTAAAELRLDRLVTHHGGITLVQSLWPGISVGTTLKIVRGVASSMAVAASTARTTSEASTAACLLRRGSPLIYTRS